MKECFEIVLRQKRKYAVRCERLSRPKKNWRKNRPHDKRGDKICRQFNYVFQVRQCRVLPRCRFNTYGQTEIKMAESARCAPRSSAAPGGFRRKWPAILTGPTTIVRCWRTC